MIHFGRMFKAARIRKGWTQQEVANKTGIPLRTYQDYEQGYYLPSADRQWDLIGVLKVDLMDWADSVTVELTKRTPFKQEDVEA